MRCYQACPECPYRKRESDPENDSDFGDFEYYLVVRSVDYSAARIGYNWPISRSNGQILIPECLPLESERD